LKALALDGVGVAVLPTYFVDVELKAKTLVSLDPPSSGSRLPRNPISLCWRRSALETARFRAVREALLTGSMGRPRGPDAWWVPPSGGDRARAARQRRTSQVPWKA
jgi:DNA-binding transcriptional LysR family regulator